MNSRHVSVSVWVAHHELILASAVCSFNGKELYVTGGNDGCIAIWDISDCFERPAKGQTTSNGLNYDIRFAYIEKLM